MSDEFSLKPGSMNYVGGPPAVVSVTKPIEDYFADWESYVFGFGYGTGEEHALCALKEFLAACPAEGTYDYRDLEKACGPSVAWLLINTLCHADVLEYGISPRFAWFTSNGKALKAYVDSVTVDDLLGCLRHDEEYTPCYPDGCNCGPGNWSPKRLCNNPFWSVHR